MMDIVKRLRDESKSHNMLRQDLTRSLEEAADEIDGLRDALDDVLRILDEAVTEHDTADYSPTEENPWTMREWFDAADREAIERARKVLKK